MIAQKYSNILFLILLILSYFSIFWKLDSHSLYHYDEARNAINALEMHFNGNYFVRYYLGQPDTWEIKPPFLTWLQLISFKTIGFNELAVRLPIALSALGTIILIFFYFKNVLQDTSTGFFSCLTLISTNGYINYHVTRTGDHDAVLIFFLLSLLFTFYKYIHKDKLTTALGLGILLFLSVFTKSIAGFFFIPGFIIYSIKEKKLFDLLKRRSFYLGILLFLILISGYYLTANHFNPGFIKLVWENEWSPRFLNVFGGKKYDLSDNKWYYFNILRTTHFKYYIWFLVFPIFIILAQKRLRNRSFYILTWSIIIPFMIILSNEVKIGWYAAPIYPLLAISIGMGVSQGLILITNSTLFNKRILLTINIIVPILFFSIPYSRILNKINNAKGSGEKFGEVLLHLENIKPTQKDYVVLYEKRNPVYIWYEQLYNRIKSYNIKGHVYKNSLEPFKNEITIERDVIICNETILNEVKKTYNSQCNLYFDKCYVCKFAIKDSMKEERQ